MPKVIFTLGNRREKISPFAANPKIISMRVTCKISYGIPAIIVR
jgi:hypothetical protein